MGTGTSSSTAAAITSGRARIPLEHYYQEYHQLPEAYTVLSKPLYRQYVRYGIPLNSNIPFFFNYYEAEEYLEEQKPRCKHELIIVEFALAAAFAYCPDATVIHSNAIYSCRELREESQRNFNGPAYFQPKRSWYLSRYCIHNTDALP